MCQFSSLCQDILKSGSITLFRIYKKNHTTPLSQASSIVVEDQFQYISVSTQMHMFLNHYDTLNYI
jgi:hypothetical protein